MLIYDLDAIWRIIWKIIFNCFCSYRILSWHSDQFNYLLHKSHWRVPQYFPPSGLFGKSLVVTLNPWLNRLSQAETASGFFAIHFSLIELSQVLQKVLSWNDGRASLNYRNLHPYLEKIYRPIYLQIWWVTFHFHCGFDPVVTVRNLSVRFHFRLMSLCPSLAK